MLLLLKTNDLLRGIETYLQTRNSSSSFIYMSKCCVKLICSHERTQFANNMLQQPIQQRGVQSLLKDLLKLFEFNLNSHLKQQLNLFKIYFYQIFLYVFNI